MTKVGKLISELKDEKEVDLIIETLRLTINFITILLLFFWQIKEQLPVPGVEPVVKLSPDSLCKLE